MKEKHRLMDDESFLMSMDNCTLDPSMFAHEAHLRLAYLNILNHGKLMAAEKVNHAILKYTSYLGAEDKYNKTLTTAAVLAVAHFEAKSMSRNFQALLEAFPRLKTHFKELMRCHYSVDIFNCSSAKVEYLEPDLLPF